MNNPRAVIVTREASHAVYVVEPSDYILDKIEMSRPTEFIHLTGVYLEGGEFECHVRAAEISEVLGVSDERFQHDLGEFMAGREARDADRIMRHNTAVQAAAQAEFINKEMGKNQEEDEPSE